MAENLENLSGEDRVAALKAKMQASAKARAAETEGEPVQASSTAAETTAVAEPTAVTSEPTSDESADAVSEPVAATGSDTVVDGPGANDVAEAEAEAVEAEVVEEEDAAVVVATDTAEAVESQNGASTNGVSAGAPVAPPPALQGIPEEDPEAAQQRQYSRREFLTYAWGAATGLVLAETGLGIYVFMYPRFRAGEFGGKFFVDGGGWPVFDDAPKGNPDGKFWMVETEDGNKKAIYMVCTHLGCLYKWEPANWRFECPCHGSKFSHDGFYIEGPAPRSLDYFALSEENGEIVVDTGAKVTGDPASDSPARRIIA